MPSPEIDQYFGLEVSRIEGDLFKAAKSLRPTGNLSNLSHVLHDGHQTWVGLDPQVLLTPYQELVHLCEILSPQAGEHMVDLGAGYGRPALVLHALYPEVYFTGFELVQERVEEGNRVLRQQGCHKARLVTQDLTDPLFQLPQAEYYFIYDYGKVCHIRQTLKEISRLADLRKFKVIARGNGSRSLIEHEHPWLSQILPVHQEENFSIYSF
jgi:hypothetical protein